MATYSVHASLPGKPGTEIYNEEFTSQTKAKKAFHDLARMHVADAEIYISLGLVKSKTAESVQCTVMASKSRFQTWVELSRSYYA